MEVYTVNLAFFPSLYYRSAYLDASYLKKKAFTLLTSKIVNHFTTVFNIGYIDDGFSGRSGYSLFGYSSMPNKAFFKQPFWAGISIYLVTRCLSNGLMIRLNFRSEILGKAGFILLACTLIFSVSLDILGASLLNGSMPTLIDTC